MAGIVTWRNVDTPNFAASNMLMRDAQNQIVGSIEKLGEVAKNYGQDLEQKNTADMVAELRKFTSSKDLNSAIANGQFSVGVLHEKGVNVDQFLQKMDARLLKLTEQEDHDEDRIALAQQRDDAHKLTNMNLQKGEQDILNAQKDRELADSNIALNATRQLTERAQAAAANARIRNENAQSDLLKAEMELKQNALADQEKANKVLAANTSANAVVTGDAVTNAVATLNGLRDANLHNARPVAEAQQVVMSELGKVYDNSKEGITSASEIATLQKKINSYPAQSKPFNWSTPEGSPESAVLAYAKNVGLDGNTTMAPWSDGNQDDIVNIVAQRVKAEQIRAKKNGEYLSGTYQPTITRDVVAKALLKVGTTQGNMNEKQFNQALDQAIAEDQQYQILLKQKDADTATLNSLINRRNAARNEKIASDMNTINANYLSSKAGSR